MRRGAWRATAVHWAAFRFRPSRGVSALSRFCSIAALAAAALWLTASSAWAGPHTAAAREAAEFVLRNFAKEAGEEGLETVAKRLDDLATRFGDEALEAARKVGPRGIDAVERAGAQGPAVASLLARHGDEALWIVEHPERLKIVLDSGDEAATAMLRHKGVADGLIVAYKKPAAEALSVLADSQNARRLAMMQQSGELAQMGRTSEVLAVVGRYGDRAMDFVWRNKGALAVGSALAAFLADPQPFLDGTRNLAEVASQYVVGPAVEAVTSEASRQTNWTLVALASVAIVGAYASLRSWLRHRSRLAAKG